MKKYLVIGFLILAALVVVYLTFLINVIKIEIGAILIGVSLICSLIAWIMWKAKED